MQRRWLALVLLVAGCASPGSLPPVAGSSPTGSPAGPASPGPSEPARPATATPEPVLTSEALRDAVSASEIRDHLQRLAAIADAHGNTRASGSPGFDASIDYMAERLVAAGYAVVRQPFALGAGTSTNLLAERAGEGGQPVVLVGAHLDSVPAGPGINDNGSGAMTLLALAEALAGLPQPRGTVRFAFWSAEEMGHAGSEAYVAALTSTERERLTAYLNLDILGSPNYIRFVYDEPGAAPGSAELTRLFAGHFESEGLAWEPIDLTGKTDHESFTAAGIPTGGLFSGGTEPKTAAQAAALGGTAGAPADPCIHLACDTLAAINDAALEEMADAIAHAVAVLAGG